MLWRKKKEPLSPQTISLSLTSLFSDHCCFYGSLSFLDFPHSTQAQRQLGILVSPLNPRLIDRSIVLFFSPFVKYWLGQRSRSRCSRGKESSKIITVYLHASWQLVEVHVPINYTGPEAWRRSNSPISTRWVPKSTYYFYPSQPVLLFLWLMVPLSVSFTGFVLLNVTVTHYSGALCWGFNVKDMFHVSLQVSPLWDGWQWIIKKGRK